MPKTYIKYGFIILFLLCAFSSAFAQETLTITTYYPSPYGSYLELRADKVAVGSAYRGTALTDGQLLVSVAIAVNTAPPLGGNSLTVTGSSLFTGGYIYWNQPYEVRPAADNLTEP